MKLSLETRVMVLAGVSKLRFSFDQMENANNLVSFLKELQERQPTEWEISVLREAVKNLGFSA